jgi:protein TonB
MQPKCPLHFILICFAIFFISNNNANAGCLSTSRFDTVPKIIVRIDSIQSIEIEPPVDAKAWVDHLSKVLTPVIRKAARKRMPVVKYTVNVKFLVNKDGSIEQATALNDPGYGLAEGAEKAVLTGPKWNPGSLDGKPVRSYHTQPIIFLITKE